MNKLLTATLALLVIVAIYTTTRIDRKFQYEAWKDRHGFKYSATEDLYRFQIYAKAVEEIDAHNADPSKTYKQGENQFTAMTKEEFVSLLTLQIFDKNTQYADYIAPEDFQPLGSVNWGSKLKVKEQGYCGSCWAFAAVAGVEAYYKIKKNKTLDLSEQELVDCDFLNYGCGGGQPGQAIDFIAQYGLVNSSQYEYYSGQTEEAGICQVDLSKFDEKATYVTGYQKVQGKAASVKSALSNYPLIVLVDAHNWDRYASGVLSECGKSHNHAVLLVGYTTDDGWIIKNSWGTGWGEKGFITLSAGNTCGVLSYPGLVY